jgi:2-methylcitrate dehydratase PrpD
VLRPEAQELMQRVKTIPVSGGPMGSRVVLKLRNGEELEETVNVSHGTPADPLSQDEIDGKFHETAGTLVGEAQRDEILGLCRRIEALPSVRELADAVGTIRS